MRHYSHAVVEAANTKEASTALREPTLSIDVKVCDIVAKPEAVVDCIKHLREAPARAEQSGRAVSVGQFIAIEQQRNDQPVR